MVWSELALLGAGAALAQGATVLQRRADRKDAREQRALTDTAVRNGQAEEQTRAALLAVAEELLLLASVAERQPDRLEVLFPDAARVLRRQALLVAHDDLRARINLARECLEWPAAILNSRLGAGDKYLARYIVGDLEPAIGAYLRHEPVPPRSERMDDCEEALREAYGQPGC